MVLVFLLICLFSFSNCSTKRAYYEPYFSEPKKIFPTPDKKESKQIKKEYKNRISLLNKEWQLYEQLREALSKKKFDKIAAKFAELKKFHNLHKNIIKFDDYYYGAQYYFAYRYLLTYQFEKAEKELLEIPKTSAFYNKALEIMNNLKKDTDDDGYNDQWEIIESTNPFNPYSHP